MKDKLLWLKDHKKEVLIGTGTFMGCMAISVIGGKTIIRLKKHENSGYAILRDMQESFSGIDNRFQVDMEEIPIKDLGAVGKQFLNHISEATEDTLVQVIAYIETKDLSR